MSLGWDRIGQDALDIHNTRPVPFLSLKCYLSKRQSKSSESFLFRFGFGFGFGSELGFSFSTTIHNSIISAAERRLPSGLLRDDDHDQYLKSMIPAYSKTQTEN